MTDASRRLRADAERNRRRLLDAARAAFAEEGLGVGVDAIARRAGVGVGTLYRRFPTKEELLAAIVEDRVDNVLCGLRDVGAIEDPWEAFAAAAEVFATRASLDRGFVQVVLEAGPLTGAADAKERLYAALRPIVARAQEAGVVRDDVVAEDVPTLCGIAVRLPRHRLDDEPELWRRYLALVLDGLRPEGAQALPHPPPRDARAAVR